MRKKNTIEETKEKITEEVMKYFIGSLIVGPDVVFAGKCLPYVVREIDFSRLSRTQQPSVDVLLMVPEILDRDWNSPDIYGLIQTDRYRFTLTRTSLKIQIREGNPEYRGGVNLKLQQRAIRRHFFDSYNKNAVWLMERYRDRAMQILAPNLLNAVAKSRLPARFLANDYSLLD